MFRRNLLALGFSALAPAAAAPLKTHLKIGDPAPDFSLLSTEGKPVKLSDYRSQTVVLAFFPRRVHRWLNEGNDGVPGWYREFVDARAKVFGISTDNVPSLRRFAEDLKLQFPLLSDFMRGVSRQYGVLIEDRGMANRTTFVVGPDGRIEHIEEGTSRWMLAARKRRAGGSGRNSGLKHESPAVSRALMINRAASYSPTHLRVQYNRGRGA